jgi:hypothetical protein
MLKAVYQIVLGLALVAGGIFLEGLWLGFCFGTVIVGIVLLIWFTPILFFPFAGLSLPGWRMFKQGLHDLRPVDIAKVSGAIGPLVRAQIAQIERAGARAPLDAKVLVYIAALSFVASRRNLSLQNVIEITGTLFTEPAYKLSVQNLQYCVDYSDNLRSFWKAAELLTPVAQKEMAAGIGGVLLHLAEEERKAHEGS